MLFDVIVIRCIKSLGLWFQTGSHLTSLAQLTRPLSVRAQNSTSRASGQSFSERLVGVGGPVSFGDFVHKLGLSMRD